MRKIEEILAENIQSRMDALGLTQEKLAEMADISKGTLQNYLYKKRQPRPEQIASVARALGVLPDSLYLDHSPNNKRPAELRWEVVKLISTVDDSQMLELFDSISLLVQGLDKRSLKPLKKRNEA